MKTILSLTAAISLLLAGCGDKSSSTGQSNSETSGNPLTAPVDYLDAAAKAKQSAVKTVDVTSVNQAIQMFHVDQGRFPKDLNELVAEKYMPKIPDAPFGSKLVYDATAGKVKVVKL